MPFIVANQQVISFATTDDVRAIDSRIFESNEGLSEDVVDGALIRSTERILASIRTTNWWKTYWIQQAGSAGSSQVIYGDTDIQVPPVDANLILDGISDFTDMCCYFALSEYILPSVADFGNPDSAERQKIGFYDEKYRSLFQQVINRGDWYDFDGTGTVTATEKRPVRTNLVRIR